MTATNAAFDRLFGGVFHDRRVLVTGCTGFKGSWLCAWLLELGAKVQGIADGIPTQPGLFEVLQLRQRIDYRPLDVRDAPAVRQAVESFRPDFVFHLAAQALVLRSYQDPLTTLTTNALGTAHVLDALRQVTHPCTAVLITSDKCYDNLEWPWGYRETDALGGRDPYSASKAAAELIIKTYFHSFFSGPETSVRVASARAGNVIGGGDWAADRIVPDCMRAWSEERPAEIRHPQATRPWQHVLEPLSGYLRLAQKLNENTKLSGEAYNFGPPAEQVHTVRDLISKLDRSWPQKARDASQSANAASQPHEAGLLKLNCDKALHDLCWTPTLEFERTAEWTATWYRRFYETGAGDMCSFTVGQVRDYVAAAAEAGKAWTQ